MKSSYFTEARICWIIFLAFLIVRVSFVIFSGYDNFQLQPDSARYNRLSSGILAGEFNFIKPLFIVSPFYPYFQAAFKFVFGSYWIFALQAAQIILCSLSGVYLYKIAKLIWERKDIAILAATIYCFFPFTFWWVHTFGQDMPFQYQFIFAVYFLLKYFYKNDFSALLYSAILFSITFLTKSHILLFAPFIVLTILLSKYKILSQKFAHIAIFAGICFMFTLPYGLYNLRANGVYVISSTRQGGFFLTGHNDDVYKSIVETPSDKEERQRLLNLDFTVFRELEPRKEGLTHSEIQKMYFDEGISWIKENPKKAITLAFF